jgi:salicylate hydroxylase
VGQVPCRSLRIAVIGAGIGGLTAADALLNLGFEVEVYERASELGEVGAGLQLGPNAIKVLRALGFEDQVRAIGFEPRNQISLSADGTLRSRRSLRDDYLAKFGAPHVTARRSDLHRILSAAVSEANVRLGKSCVSVESSDKAAVAHFSDGTSVEADIVIGADGIRSILREQCFGQDSPRFTKSMCWRCAVPIACVPREPVGPDRIMIGQKDYFSWYGSNGQVICYPVGGDGSTLNIFAGHVSTDWVEESWTLPSSKEELKQAYSGWSPILLEMFDHVEQCFKWGIFDRDPRESWIKGRVALLGDAAHPTMPNLAQGANMAIEDGYVLARALEQHVDAPISGLEAYVSARQPRTSRITLQSRENFERSMKVPPAPPVDRTWIYSFDATQASA